MYSKFVGNLTSEIPAQKETAPFCGAVSYVSLPLTEQPEVQQIP